jgi:hypothetical protein
MSFLLTVLATCNTFLNYYTQKKTALAAWLRQQLGPQPQNWVLLQDNRILPSTLPLPPHIQSNAYLFNIQTSQITKMDGTAPGRHRPLSILALQIQHTDVGSIDISDWVGEIRIFPSRDITPRQLVELWSAVHNRYVPLEDVRAVVTRNDGSVENVVLSS